MAVIQDLFKVPILRTVLNLNLNNIKLFCDRLKENQQGRQKSNKGGWQSFDFTNSVDGIKDLKEAIILKSKELAKSYNFKESINYKIGSIWVNYNYKNNYNMKHIHPDCIFSGVFYVECDESNPAKISFFHPAYDLLGYDWHDHLLNEYVEQNSPIWYFDPEPQQLILFPSWLHHQVEYNPSDKVRISISFNIIQEK